MKKRSVRWRKTLFWVFLLALLLVMLRRFEHNQVYHPSRQLEARITDAGRPAEDVFFQSSDGVKLNGWFFPADAHSFQTGRVVLVCHGNGGNISYRLDLYVALLELNLSVFAFDYRGYGQSEGRPSEEGTYRDGQAACGWLRQKGFAEKNILVYGESLGGGIASEICLREPTGGLILQSTFTSIPDIGAELFPWLPVRWINTIKYDTLRKLPRIHVPVLVMHSREDNLIPFHHSETNFAAANPPKLFWQIKGGHSDPLSDRSLFAAGMQKYLQLMEAH